MRGKYCMKHTQAKTFKYSALGLALLLTACGGAAEEALLLEQHQLQQN